MVTEQLRCPECAAGRDRIFGVITDYFYRYGFEIVDTRWMCRDCGHIWTFVDYIKSPFFEDVGHDD